MLPLNPLPQQCREVHHQGDISSSRSTQLLSFSCPNQSTQTTDPSSCFVHVGWSIQVCSLTSLMKHCLRVKDSAGERLETQITVLSGWVVHVGLLMQVCMPSLEM